MARFRGLKSILAHGGFNIENAHMYRVDEDTIIMSEGHKIFGNTYPIRHSLNAIGAVWQSDKKHYALPRGESKGHAPIFQLRDQGHKVAFLSANRGWDYWLQVLHDTYGLRGPHLDSGMATLVGDMLFGALLWGDVRGSREIAGMEVYRWSKLLRVISSFDRMLARFPEVEEVIKEIVSIPEGDWGAYDNAGFTDTGY